MCVREGEGRGLAGRGLDDGGRVGQLLTTRSRSQGTMSLFRDSRLQYLRDSQWKWLGVQAWSCVQLESSGPETPIQEPSDLTKSEATGWVSSWGGQGRRSKGPEPPEARARSGRINVLESAGKAP